MRKLITVLAVGSAIASGVSVLHLKAKVKAKNDEVKQLARQIHQDKEAIRITEAEWAYLTAPRALQDRSIEFLALMPPRAKQIIGSPASIPFRPNGADVEAAPGVVRPVAEKRRSSDAKEKRQGL